MASKTFQPGTLIDSPWLNDVNRAAYGLLGDGVNVASTKAEARSLLGLGSLSFRNRLINATGIVDQRNFGSGFSSSSGNFYFIDRWRTPAPNSPVTWTTLASGSKQFSTSPAGMEQVIEGSNTEGGVFTLSWTGGAAGYVNNSLIPNGGSISVPTGQPVTIKLIGVFSEPQFEKGSVPSPFEYRPFSYEMEQCQRYFYSFDGQVASCTGQVQSATYALGIFTLPVIMRTNPTFIANNVGCTNAGGGQVAANAASLAFGNNRVVGLGLGFGPGSGLVAGNATIFLGLGSTSYLRFDAEL